MLVIKQKIVPEKSQNLCSFCIIISTTAVRRKPWQAVATKWLSYMDQYNRSEWYK